MTASNSSDRRRRQEQQDDGRVWLSFYVVTLLIVVALPTANSFQISLPGIQSVGTSTSKTMLQMFNFDNNNQQHPHSDAGDKLRRNMEFLNLEPLPESQTRKERMERDLETKEQFAKYGDELWNLRQTMNKLMDKLAKASRGETHEPEELIRERLLDAEQRDPELVYELEMLEMEMATREKDHEQVEDCKERAQAARSCLPQFNLEGLWVGK